MSIKPTALPSRIVLISTTGVYGDCNGAWINESQRLRPQTDRARRRVDAEKVIEDWHRHTGIITVILRVSGIYGPDRLPISRLERREPVLAPEQSPWSNRIHIEDLIRVCIAAARNPHPSRIYNVSDGNPSTMAEFFCKVAKTHNLPPPPVIDRELAEKKLNPKMLSYLNESKRIDNTLMCEHLGVVPNFPDLNAGLQPAATRL
jgi:nucleoside-diphosphate-sugar epimerase